MKLTTVTNLSLDGVTQGHRRIDADSRQETSRAAVDGAGAFERVGWAFLFGRRTYDIFAGSWGAGVDPGNPVGEALNTRPKYVASSTLTDTPWPGTTVLSGDVAGAVEELRAEPSGELQVWGSGTLVRWLLSRRLVDEIVLLVYPVVVGHGTRLFAATGPDIGLDLVGLQSTAKGLTIQTFRTTGRPQYETA